MFSELKNISFQTGKNAENKLGTEAIAKELKTIMQKSKNNKKQQESESRNSNPLHKLAKTEELKQMLAKSELNCQGHFGTQTRREQASVLLETVRALTPNSLRLWNLERKYGGLPKKGQNVRVGHLSRFSEMIDKAEAMALENIGF